MNLMLKWIIIRMTIFFYSSSHLNVRRRRQIRTERNRTKKMHQPQTLGIVGQIQVTLPVHLLVLVNLEVLVLEEVVVDRKMVTPPVTTGRMSQSMKILKKRRKSLTTKKMRRKRVKRRTNPTELALNTTMVALNATELALNTTEVVLNPTAVALKST